jgi:hypothetical protein
MSAMSWSEVGPLQTKEALVERVPERSGLEPPPWKSRYAPRRHARSGSPFVVLNADLHVADHREFAGQLGERSGRGW